MKNYQLKLLVTFLIVFSCTLFFVIDKTQAIYKEVKGTTISLSVLDPSSNHTVTLVMNDGTGNTTTVIKAHNAQMGSDLITPTRENYNFMGWFDSNNRRIYADEQITSDVTFHAEWTKIICKKVATTSNLNTETCVGSSGCRTTGVGYSANATITYGTIFGEGSPIAGDAYDCDVYYNANTDTFDETDAYGKHIERFYFVREKVNSGSEDTAVLVYYTSFDGNGRVDTQHTSKDNIGSDHYDEASSWLPTSSTWTNPGLIDFDPNNGKVSRFLSVDDLVSMCGSLSNSGTADASYFINCFGGTKQNWFLFENSRFQSSNLARAGIWLETDGTKYYRIQTSSIAVNSWTDGESSDNIARPVIEIPMSALDGFVNANRYTISFETHDGSAVSSFRRYEGEQIGTIPTTTRNHYTFDGWYATYSNGVYSDPVDSTVVVHSDLTLHAKWVAKPTCEVTLVLNGGTGVTSPVIVDIGDLYTPETPTKANSTFVGWFTDSATTVPYNSATPISTATLTLYAKWTSANYVAEVEGVGQYETLAEAFANVPTTGTKTKVTLLQNVTFTVAADCVSVNNNQYIDFDLNGHTVSGGDAAILFTVNKGGKLEVGSSSSGGAINNTGTKMAIIINGSGNNNEGTLYIKDGANINSTGSAPAIGNRGDVYMTGGVITCSAQQAAVNTGTANDQAISTAQFIMSGGRITTSNAKKNQAIYNNGGSRVEISGDAYLYSQSSNADYLRATVHNNNGTMIITGGTIVSKNYSAVLTGTGNSTSVTIGNDNGVIDNTTPVLRGKTYGLEGTNASIYDGIFESETNTRAISVTNITKPNVDFYDTTVTEGGNTYYATYLLPATFTVTFYPQNGEDPIVRIITNGSAIGSYMPNNPVKANYYFDGYYDNNTLIDSSTVPISDINAYARWVQSVANATINSALSVEKNNSETIAITGVDIESCSFATSDSTIATVNSNGVVTGVEEGSATITITGTKSGVQRTVTVTVTPEVHEVKFYKHAGESPIATEIVADGGTVSSMPSNPTDENYVFNGWVYDNGVALTEFTSAVQVTGDIDVIATWKEKVSYATLTISPDPFEIVRGGTGQISLDPTDPNGVIENYNYSSNDTFVATVDANGEVTAVDVGTATITITGASGATKTVEVTVYIETHDITFYTDTNKQTVLSVVTVEDNHSIANTPNASMPNNPTKENYIFDGWVYDNGVTLTTFTSAVQVTGDIDVIPSWIPSIQLATVPSTFAVALGGYRTISVTGPNGMESYTFSSDDGSIATVDPDTGEVYGVDYGTTNIIITGSRSTLTKIIPVTVGVLIHEVHFYDDDGVTELYQSVSVNNGGTVGNDMPGPPTKAGLVFDGWICDDGNSLTPFTSATEIYDDIDAIAVWKEPISSATVDSTINIMLGESTQITFTPTGTKPVENYTIASSDSNTVEVSNHTIYGTDIGTVTLTITGSLSGLTRTVTVNVTNSYAVVFKDDEDTVLQTIYVENGSTIDATEGATLPNNPTKSGYTFDDWYIYDGSDVTTTRLDTSAPVTSNLVYKPRWAGANDVAAIGTTYYTTYKAAVDSLVAGVETEIRLLKNVAATGFANNRGKIDYGMIVTINGNNHTLECSGGNAIWNGGTLTIKNITVTCGTSKTAPIDNGGSLTVIDSNISMTLSGGDGRAAIYNGQYNSSGNPTSYGSVIIMGNSNISTEAKDRSAVQNAVSGTSIDIRGGTITQAAGDSTKYAVEIISRTTGSISGGTIIAVKNNAVSNSGGTLTITGGSITAQSGLGVYNTGTLTIGTSTDNTYDVTNPVIQGETYGINSTVNYSLYDGIIKGKSNNRAVNDFNKITGTQAGYERVTGVDGNYYTLYYSASASKYRIYFEGNGGTVSDQYIDYDLNQQITASDLATATKGVYTFAGWYTSEDQPFEAFIPTQAGSTTYHATWSYASTTTPVNHILTSDAMTYYFSNVSSWVSADAQIANNQDQPLNNDDHTTYLSNMLTNFNNYSCSECEINSTRENMNSCNSPGTGTYCDQPKGYDTGIEDDLDVYLYVNNAKSGSKLNGTNSGDYITSDDGVIYNMIPGKTYYWESQNDSSIYGVVSVTKDGTNYRRTLKSSIRNLRDLGGMSVSYTENGVTTNGTIKYGKLYRGAQNAYGNTGISELQALGITREVDLRGTGDGNTSQTKFPAANYDVSTSDSLYTRFNNKNTYTTDQYKDVKITNYIINPTANYYFSEPHSDNFQDLKQAMKAIMRQIVNHEVVYFHCTIGTDRTGTIAYFLEGLLGASNEDRLRDYEMTYFFGLTNRSRFHNNLSTSNINPRFYAMYKSYPNVSDIEDFYFNNYPESDDATLLSAFRAEMIQ